jgi:phosphoribosylglycinamide formyltransferase-1
MKDTPPFVVLISGNGSNLQAILDALPGSVSAVISNQPQAYGLVRAQQAGLPAIALPRLPEEPRRAYDTRLVEQVAAYQPAYVILAGWMRLLTMNFLGQFPGRVINLHPALPGTFPGTHAIERAYQAFQRGEISHTGIMIHLVPDEGVDNGPLLATAEVPIYPDDALETLEERIHTAEHALLVQTLQKILATL